MGSNHQQPDAGEQRELDQPIEGLAATAAKAIEEHNNNATQEFGNRTDLEEDPAEAPSVEIFSVADLTAFIASTDRSNTDADTRHRNKALGHLLMHRGGVRRLFRLPEDWERQIDLLEADYPHFREFIGHVRAMCLLARLDNGVVELEPLLANGVPGTGKSTFVERLLGILVGAYVRVSMSAAESGALLGGSQETWANSKPGLVFTTLVEGEYANPLMLMDELDKASTDATLNPLGPAYQLLETALARRFNDLSVPALRIDASHIVWMATSNDATRIPEPIRQRFVEFEIPLPTPAQSLVIVRSVLRWLQQRHPRLRLFALDDAAAYALVGLAPREMRKRLRMGCGQAAQDGRRVVLPSDLPANARQGRRMGF